VDVGSRGLSSDTAAAWLAVLGFLLRDDLEARKLGDPKGGRRDVRGVTTASHYKAADAGMIVARVYGVPTAIEKDFGPGAEIHRTDISRRRERRANRQGD
jgi:hypothetical protein